MDNMTNRSYFSKKVKERYTIFLRTLRKLSIFQIQTSIDINKKNLHQFNAVIYCVMFPDKVIGMKITRKEDRKKDRLKKSV